MHSRCHRGCAVAIAAETELVLLSTHPLPGCVLILEFDLKIPILIRQRLVGLFPVDEKERNTVWPGMLEIGEQHFLVSSMDEGRSLQRLPPKFRNHLQAEDPVGLESVWESRFDLWLRVKSSSVGISYFLGKNQASSSSNEVANGPSPSITPNRCHFSAGPAPAADVECGVSHGQRSKRTHRTEKLRQWK